MLEVSGPITILNVLIDIKQIFKGMRKDFEFMKSVFHKVGTQILSYIKEAKIWGRFHQLCRLGWRSEYTWPEDGRADGRRIYL